MPSATKLVVTLSMLALACGAHANGTTSFGINPRAVIPDGTPGGWKGQIQFSGLSGTVTNIQVRFDALGGYNGDLFMSLAAPGGTESVLLNRPGITSGNPFGYSNSGFNVVLDSGAPNNIHFYGVNYSVNSAGQVIGTWSADGRNISPDAEPLSFDQAPITASLDLFVGRDAASLNGVWEVYMADYAVGGGETTLNSVTVQITSVPEPSTGVLLLFAGVGLLGCFRRQRSRR